MPLVPITGTIFAGKCFAASDKGGTITLLNKLGMTHQPTYAPK